MAERIIHEPSAIAALAERLENETQIPRAHLEKDLWVTEVLRVLERQDS